jgi:hypothetical protein
LVNWGKTCHLYKFCPRLGLLLRLGSVAFSELQLSAYSRITRLAESAFIWTSMIASGLTVVTVAAAWSLAIIGDLWLLIVARTPSARTLPPLDSQSSPYGSPSCRDFVCGGGSYIGWAKCCGLRRNVFSLMKRGYVPTSECIFVCYTQ